MRKLCSFKNLTEKQKEITKGKIKNSWTSIICRHEWKVDIKCQSLKYWLLVAEEAMDMKFSFFMEKKSDTKEKLIPLLKELRDTYKKKIKQIHCDNAGEINILEKQCIEEEMGILFEYTAPGTPQQNSIVERLFQPCLEK